MSININEEIAEIGLVGFINSFLNLYFDIEGTYTVSEDGVIDVDGYISLNSEEFNELNLTELPIQFGHISGSFEFEKSNITSLKGFPHTVEGHCSINYSHHLKSLEFSPKCEDMHCENCSALESLDYLDCFDFYGENLNLQRFCKNLLNNFKALRFEFTEFPTPTADEMRQLIRLNPDIIVRMDTVLETIQDEPWIKLIQNYYEHKDMFRAAQEFEALYNEPWVKPEQQIDIINSDVTIGF